LQKSSPRISIKTYATENSTVIAVEDNGIGINTDFQEQIFDMFFVTNSNKGTGLGLYIVKEAVVNIGATIEVNSEIGIGSTFTVTIPHQNET
jgi:signal transduction histidine kinase